MGLELREKSSENHAIETVPKAMRLDKMTESAEFLEGSLRCTATQRSGRGSRVASMVGRTCTEVWCSRNLLKKGFGNLEGFTLSAANTTDMQKKTLKIDHAI